MRFDEYRAHDGLALAELVRRREVTAAELVDAAIEGIDRYDGVLNAVVHRADGEARATARAEPSGPFGGVPFLVKDLAHPVAGWPCTAASRFAADEPDTADSELVARYRAAGVVLVGRTNTPEFGIPGVTTSERFGPCRNPWDPTRTPGGSSGGSAAAVAAGFVPLAHASDGLGSIRIPAACCGLVGLKVTRDRTPDTPPDLLGRAIGLVVDHVVTRTVRDTAAMLDATDAPDPGNPYASPPKARPFLDEVGTPPGRLRIGFSPHALGDRAPAPEVQAGLEATVALLEELGHDLVPHDLHLDWRRFYRAQGVLSAADFAGAILHRAEALGRQPGPDELGPLARRAFTAGTDVSGRRALWALQELRVLSRRILADLAPFDVYLTPVTGTAPPRVDELDPAAMDLRDFDRAQARAFPYTPPFNVTGQPAISLPLAWTPAGLPLGMMFAGRYGDEATLLRLAAQLEEARPWRDRRPDLDRLLEASAGTGGGRAAGSGSPAQSHG